MILPTVLYGSAVWWTNKSQLMSLRRFSLKLENGFLVVVIRPQMKWYWVTWTIRLNHSKLKWHIRCSTLSKSRLVKQVLEGALT
eukprot:Awhi_evm1s3952